MSLKSTLDSDGNNNKILLNSNTKQQKQTTSSSNDIISQPFNDNNNIDNDCYIKEPNALSARDAYIHKANLEHILELRTRDAGLRLNQLKEENKKVAKLRENYETLMAKLQKDIKDFNANKDKEKAKFEKWKTDQLNILSKEKSEFQKEKSNYILYKSKLPYTTIIDTNTKLQSEINQLKTQNIILQLKLTACHHLLNTLNINISQLETTFPSFWNSPHQSKSLLINTILHDNNILPLLKSNYEFVIDTKYNDYNQSINDNDDNIINDNTLDDGTRVIKYKDGKCIVKFNSGVSKIKYNDKHQISLFPNGDITQRYSNGNEVTLFNNTRNVLWKLKDEQMQIMKFNNNDSMNQIEFMFDKIDGIKVVKTVDCAFTFINTATQMEETFLINGALIQNNKQTNEVLIYN